MPASRTTSSSIPSSPPQQFAAGSAAHIRAQGLHVSRGDRQILNDVGVIVSAGSRLAVVGENGRGKTTLLQVLAGITTPDAGTVARHGTIAFVGQDLPVGARTVGSLVDDAVGDALAAVEQLDRAAADLATGTPGAEDAYADALDLATRLDAWDTQRCIDIALEALSACAGGAVQAFNRRVEELEAHRITVPVPPRHLNLPASGTRPGAPIVDVTDARVAGRLRTPVSVALTGGDRLLIVGPNGAGKSTLLAVLAGQTHPDEGRVDLRRDARGAFLSQEVPSWDPYRTAHEIYDEQRRRLETDQPDVPSLRGLGLLDAAAARTPVARLSQGQQRRLHLALCLAARADLLLLDEPTNHLSASLDDELTEALQNVDCAVVVATHDRKMLHDLEGWPRIELAGQQVSWPSWTTSPCTVDEGADGARFGSTAPVIYTEVSD